MNNWKHKLAAWVHDPGEKPWVLMRDRAGHEGGTVRSLRSILFDQDELNTIDPIVKKADHWASAADRPQWPQSQQKRFADQVRFYKNPVLIHPLTGDTLTVASLQETSVEDIKLDSLELFKDLVVEQDGVIDAKRTALAFWRFAPEQKPERLGEFWKLAPADTRVPDHSIWQHLDLTAAFATAMTADENNTPALLSMSFGPVQDFIAEARTTSDLWAGSHLLSRIAWQGLKKVCEQFGPDNIIFPQLRGMPEVDIWLQQEMGLDKKRFKNTAWMKQKDDSNPLFSAALPNRFVALVPADQVEDIAHKVQQHVKQWVLEQAEEMLATLADELGENLQQDIIHSQLEYQMRDFPEVHWASVSWELIGTGSKGIDTHQLDAAISQLTHPDFSAFTRSNAWQLLQGEMQLDGQTFYKPNPGVLYPALYDLLDRVMASTKTEKAFSQARATGFRCSLCGEREWLTDKRSQLTETSKKRGETLWDRVHKKRPSWARAGEHLCVICATKRLWPGIVLNQAKSLIGEDEFNGRFVVSTHTMAMESDLACLANSELKAEKWSEVDQHGKTAALPKRLNKRLTGQSKSTIRIIRRLPDYIDWLNDEKQNDKRLDDVEKLIKNHTEKKPETYYAMLLLDGDNMGAWLTGENTAYTVPYRRSWHPQIQSTLNDQTLEEYASMQRPASPARHMAISASLNGFALDLVRIVVEDIYGGKLIYAGGDDVMAMLPVADLLPAMIALRLVYSGAYPGDDFKHRTMSETLEYADETWKKPCFSEISKRLWLRNGFVYDNDRKQLYRVMGRKATASCGAVIAHHTAPLGLVLRELRTAESRAKSAGRNAYSISVMKRAGGNSHFTDQWFGVTNGEAHKLQQGSVSALLQLSEYIADGTLSRRAIYIIRDWMQQLPEAGYMEAQQYKEMIGRNLAYQFKQQSDNSKTSKDWLDKLARHLTDCAFSGHQHDARQYLHQLMAVSEFLARGNRTQQEKNHA